MKKEKSYKAEQFQLALKSTIKQLAGPVIILAIAVVAVLLILKFAVKDEEPVIYERAAYDGTMDPIVIQNNDLKLTFDPATTQIEVEVLKTGAVWRSNPEGVGIDDPDKSQFASAVMLTYQTQRGETQIYNSYQHSAVNGLYELETGSDYITVNYSLGEVEREYIIPPVLTVEELDAWLAKFDPDDVQDVKERYKKLDKNNLKKSDKEREEEYTERYPLFSETVIYVFREETGKSAKASLEKKFENIGYTYEEYLADKERDLKQAGSDKPIFNLQMTYRLVGDELVVELPLSSIEYPLKMFPTTITMLPYFGAGTSSEEGYVLVPEGGGGIINFNNGKIRQNNYAASMYGWDKALGREQLVQDPKSYFNAFAVAKNGSSVLCTLEDGVAYATIKADIAGKKHNILNYAQAEYTILAKEEYDVGSIANSRIWVFQNSLPDEKLVQKYRFVDSDDYTDIAMSYRKYLMDKYPGAFQKKTAADVPVVVDVIGAIDKVKQVVGIPVSKPLPLTTFKEAEEMLDRLTGEDGIKNLSIKLSGWCNGGVKQNILKRVQVLSCLGGKSGLDSLTKKAQGMGVPLYLNGITAFEYKSNLLDGFFSYADAAKTVTKERAAQHIYSTVTYAEREGTEPFYLLHADLGLKMMDNLNAAANKYNTGISFDDVGKDLASDFYIKEPTSRQQNMLNQAAKMKEYAESGMPMMINAGNDYALPYADVITNMNLTGIEYILLDANVPFYQMAIHGYVDYTGFPINICGDDAEQVLRCAEYGAGLQFTLMQEDSFALQKTLYSQYYGSDIDAWNDRMVEIYKRYESELGHTYNQEMVDHTSISPELSCTEYADGTKVYVNYSYDAIVADGVTVPARDYKVVR